MAEILSSQRWQHLFTDSEMEKKLIGVFDSGVGGLTVLSALKKRIGSADFVYFGDTARLPYGMKSKESVLQYSIEAVNFLISKNVDLIVVACNTATSISLSALQEKYTHTPIIGVIDSGAKAAVESSMNGRIAVIATRNTISMNAYEETIQKLGSKTNIISKACPLLVPLAEEGWLSGNIAKNIIEEYITPLLKEFSPHKPDCLVLGCTHFPFFRDVIAEVIGPDIKIVDSAESTSLYIHEKYFSDTNMCEPSVVEYYVTDSPDQFIKTGNMLLNDEIIPDNVKFVPIEDL